jgi:hypothetical protein
MMAFTWYLLGVLAGGAAWWLYRMSRRMPLGWFGWCGLGGGIFLLLFSIAWGVAAVLEGVPRAGSMGLLMFGLTGIVSLTVTGRVLKQRSARSAPEPAIAEERSP